MASSGIDFQKIRPHLGSQAHGFEELSCQIASLEARPASDIFYRKGLGADAGVECFVKHGDGSETGWQAKWFSKFGDSQLAQLDKSIEQALAKHPRLKKYIVCLPIDLRDARVGKERSELHRWQAWIKKWKERARKTGRSISIDLWGAAHLIQHLTRNDPLYAGRVRYWFDHTLLDTSWFKQRFAEARMDLGERYTPETNVDLPIRRTLLAFGRDPVVQKEIDSWLNKLEEARYRAIDSLDRRVDQEKKAYVRELEDATSRLVESISRTPADPDAELPLDDWRDQAERATKASYPCITALQDAKPDENKQVADDKRYAIHHLQQLNSLLREFLYALRDDRWRVVNSRRLLVFGDAGVGKSHLFGDAVEHWNGNEQPTLLLLGSSFADADPWSQILDQLGLQNLDRDTFLGALDAAAQAAGTRAVFLIDAINERNGLEVWPARLAGFLQSIEQFPRVSIGLSCRSSYLPFLVNSIDETRLPRIEHVGFAGRAGEAAQIYLDRRGIVRMAVPNLVPEFENPLFLKTCCDYLRKEGSSEFPRGLRGVTNIFEFYFMAVARQIEKKLKLDPAQDIVARAISALAEAGDQSERGYIAKAAAHDILEALLSSQGLYERSLLSQLASEGVLSIEPVRQSDGSFRDYVRFTFERYSDHRIAAALLDKHLDPAQPLASFAAGSRLHTYVTDKHAYRKMGVIEAIAIQLPERCEAELPDVVSAGPETDSIVQRAFLRSVLWRNQKCFRKRTWELLQAISRHTGDDEATRTIIAVATEPENEFNALYLHRYLSAIAMPARDERWSTYIALEGDSEGNPIQTLITWIAHNGLLPIDDNRAELAAIALSWFFTSSHRVSRDKATKALATLLAVRLPLATKLIRRFAYVDDAYVLDRVIAAAYGAALQAMQKEHLGELAATVFDVVFAPNEVIGHVLIRDHARGIIELAQTRGVLPAEIDISRARPPYRSPWPLKDVSNARIERYVEKYPGGVFTDEIVRSCVRDGDFARYEIDPAVGHWSSLPVSVAGKTEHALFADWKKGALQAKPKAETPLNKLVNAYDRLRGEQKKNPFPVFNLEFIDPKDLTTWKRKADGAKAKAWKKKERALGRLESELESALGKHWWTEYCRYARSYVQRDIHNLSVRHLWPSRFDNKLIRRWICKRAHDLGWTPERFGEFDRNVRDTDRREHRIERIGKKYQWIALHEAVAHLADNTAFIGDNRDALEVFQGPWQIGSRNIDPSLLVTQTFDEPWRQSTQTWWMPAKTHLKPVSCEERLLWRDSEADFWNDPSLIAVTEQQSGEKWLVIDEYAGWHQWGRDRGEKTYERAALFTISCLLVKASELRKLIAALSGRILWGSHDLPSLELPYNGYIGEYCWHPLYGHTDDWAASDIWNKIPVATLPMKADYSAKHGEFDYSIDDSFNFKVPSPGLARGLGLRLSDGRTISFTNASGKVVFFDPSTKEAGPSAALVERTALLNFLAREKLDAVWIVTSKKEVFGGKKHDGGWGGERLKCSLYWLTKDGFARKDHEEQHDPTPEQLKAFWEYEGAAEPSVKSTPAKVRPSTPKIAVKSRRQKARSDKSKRSHLSGRSRSNSAGTRSKKK